MKMQLAQILCLVIALFSSAASGAQNPLRPPSIFDLKAIDAYLADYVRAKNLPGLSVGLVKNGELVLVKGYGKRSLEDDRPVEAGTLFPIGSITKQFTCACVLLLAEQRKLSVHDPVAKYFPNLTSARDITLLDLMNNVSGYADYYPLDFVDRRMRRPVAADDLLREYAGGKLDFEPGTRYSYSNTGFILLGRVVEMVSGQSFAAFLTQQIFKPLGMDQTGYELDPSDPRLARGYATFALSKPEPTPPEARGWIGAAGAICSTAADLATWDLALMGGKVLKPESFELMTTPRKLADGRLTDYGCGLALRLQGGRKILAHNGAVSGFVAWNAVVPSTKSALVMFCNQEVGLGPLPNQIFSLLLKEPAPNVPRINGPPADEVTKKTFADLQKGRVNRAEWSEEFNLFLNDRKIAGASKRLREYGAIKSAEILSANERGGMEVTETRLNFRRDTLKVQMYRMPSGKIEQFFVYPD